MLSVTSGIFLVSIDKMRAAHRNEGFQMRNDMPLPLLLLNTTRLSFSVLKTQCTCLTAVTGPMYSGPLNISRSRGSDI